MINKLKKIIPEALLRTWFKFKWTKNYKYKKFSTQQIFSEIYSNNIWGKDNDNIFCSGPGTTTQKVELYINFLNEFIKKHKVASVVDLGCGDFRIMKKVIDEDTKLFYTGIDIVPELINYNQEKFGSGKVKFICLDAITDELPKGDLITVRQVLQHLDNSQIQVILKKLGQYKYVLISEHLPTENIIPNIDKLAGPNNRLFFNSGVFLNKPPFSVNTKKVFEFKDTDYTDLKSIIRESVIATYLIKN